MHGVVFYTLLVDGAERVEADVKGDRGPANAPSVQLAEEALSEVEAGGGCGGGAFGAGVNGLVALGVSGLLVDVGRERHLSEGVEQGTRRHIETEDAPAKLGARNDLGLEVWSGSGVA